MDRITKSLLDEFSNNSELTHLDESTRFEHFGSYLAVTRHYADSFDTGDIVTGSGGDTGIDGLCILVNGVLITEPEAVEELAETNGYVDATFVFVQAERSEGFDSAKIGQFGFGVSDFFSQSPKLPRNEHIKYAADIMSAIYDRSSNFKRGNPACKLFYVTSGKWVGDQNLEARRKTVVDDLEQLGIFRDVEFMPVGADSIQKLYNQSKNAIAKDFTFAERTVIPDIEGVTEAYLGLLPAKEFVGLLDDGNGEILRSVFYDNVRDWQDYNQVNNEIRTSLNSEAQRALFVLMNNGITIIAKSMRATGNRFHIEDYQIVNGCQTSHVLFDNQSLLDESVIVPIRVIATENEEAIASIVKATNRQTEVKAEQLIALSDFQKKLEAYFQTFDAPNRLYYERRSRQYNSMLGVEKTRIVPPANLIRAYASVFLEEPHRTTRTYRALLGQLGTSIFGPDDRLEPYYYSASALYRLEFLFRNNLLDVKYKPARYLILFAARLLLNPARPPRSNSREMARYCEPLIEIAWDQINAGDAFHRAAGIVEKIAKGNFDRDNIRTQTFTEEVRKECMGI